MRFLCFRGFGLARKDNSWKIRQVRLKVRMTNGRAKKTKNIMKKSKNLHDGLQAILTFSVGLTVQVRSLKTKALSEISGDYSFAQYGKKGVFHSYTYTYFRVGDRVELFGSCDERYGYTVFSVSYETNLFTIAKDVDGLETDDEIILLDITCFNGGYNEVFDKYFGSMNLRKPKVDHLSGYTSWYNYFQKINEEIILRDIFTRQIKKT